MTVSTVEKTVREGATELVRAVASVGRRVSDELEKNFTPPSAERPPQGDDEPRPPEPPSGPDAPPTNRN
ncbi:MAG TPA: hypothetical protein VFS43_21825 [Polyangiaceae bacterium]|nr:hypothetical protein [Polyangiaceae bacterium]